VTSTLCTSLRLVTRSLVLGRIRRIRRPPVRQTSINRYSRHVDGNLEPLLIKLVCPWLQRRSFHAYHGIMTPEEIFTWMRRNFTPSVVGEAHWRGIVQLGLEATLRERVDQGLTGSGVAGARAAITARS